MKLGKKYKNIIEKIVSEADLSKIIQIDFYKKRDSIILGDFINCISDFLKTQDSFRITTFAYFSTIEKEFKINNIGYKVISETIIDERLFYVIDVWKK